MNPVIENIKKRRSVRRYSQTQVEAEKIEQIIEAGSFAPSGHNDQPWHFTVIQNKDLIDKINLETKALIKDSEDPTFRKMGQSERLHLLYNAPTVIVISGDPVNSYSMEEDLGAATQNMLLAAHSLGLSTCWIGLVTVYFEGEKKDEILKEMEIPAGFVPQYVITLGYSNLTRDLEAPKRRENIVNYIK